MSEPGFPLAEAIVALKQELNVARQRGEENPWFRFEKVDLKVAVTRTRTEAGKLGLSVVGLGAERTHEGAAAHTFELALTLHLLSDAELEHLDRRRRDIARGGQFARSETRR